MLYFDSFVTKKPTITPMLRINNPVKYSSGKQGNFSARAPTTRIPTVPAIGNRIEMVALYFGNPDVE